MPRRGSIQKRDVLADPVYNSKLVTRLINNIMLDGKNYFFLPALGRFAPYLERDCIRPLTP